MWTDTVVRRLARAALQIERAFGGRDQDIEWIISGGFGWLRSELSFKSASCRLITIEDFIRRRGKRNTFCKIGTFFVPFRAATQADFLPFWELVFPCSEVSAFNCRWFDLWRSHFSLYAFRYSLDL